MSCFVVELIEVFKKVDIVVGILIGLEVCLEINLLITRRSWLAEIKLLETVLRL